MIDGGLALVVTVGGNKSFEWHNEQLGFKNADINEFDIHN